MSELDEPEAPRLRITVTAQVADEPGSEYTAVEMLLELASGLSERGCLPTLLQLEIATEDGPAPTA